MKVTPLLLGAFLAVGALAGTTTSTCTYQSAVDACKKARGAWAWTCESINVCNGETFCGEGTKWSNGMCTPAAGSPTSGSPTECTDTPDWKDSIHNETCAQWAEYKCEFDPKDTETTKEEVRKNCCKSCGELGGGVVVPSPSPNGGGGGGDGSTGGGGGGGGSNGGSDPADTECTDTILYGSTDWKDPVHHETCAQWAEYNCKSDPDTPNEVLDEEVRKNCCKTCGELEDTDPADTPTAGSKYTKADGIVCTECTQGPATECLDNPTFRDKQSQASCALYRFAPECKAWDGQARLSDQYVEVPGETAKVRKNCCASCTKGTPSLVCIDNAAFKDEQYGETCAQWAKQDCKADNTTEYKTMMAVKANCCKPCSNLETDVCADNLDFKDERWDYGCADWATMGPKYGHPKCTDLERGAMDNGPQVSNFETTTVIRKNCCRSCK